MSLTIYCLPLIKFSYSSSNCLVFFSRASIVLANYKAFALSLFPYYYNSAISFLIGVTVVKISAYDS